MISYALLFFLPLLFVGVVSPTLFGGVGVVWLGALLPALILLGTTSGKVSRWLYVWIYWGAAGGLARMALAMEFKPNFCFWLLPLIGILFWRFKKIANLKLNGLSPIWVASCLVLFPWNLHPQWDIDSLRYHVFSITWLWEKIVNPSPIFQIQNFGYDLRFIGLEEFLQIPFLSGSRDPYLTAGILGGLFKMFGLGTLLSLVPNRLGVIQLLMTLIVFWDDQWFFSGQSQYIYLNPAFVALILIWCLLLGRRRSESRIQLLMVSLLLASTKYHGLFFLIAGITVFTLDLKKWQIKKHSAFSLLLCFIPVLALYGLNILETGTPIYPSSLWPFQAKFYQAGKEAMQNLFPSGSFLGAIRNPFTTLIYPGNLAMKLSAILLLPTLVSAIFFRKRLLNHAAQCFVVCLVWAAISEALVHQESRYPRYGFFAAVAGIFYFSIFSLTKIFRDRRRLSVFFYRGLFATALILTFVVLFHPQWGINFRYRNIPPHLRTDWRLLTGYWASPKHLTKNYRDPVFTDRLESLAREYITEIEPCLIENQIPLDRGFVVFSPTVNWPTALAAGYSPRADMHAELLEESLRESRPRLILPRSWQRDLPSDLRIARPNSAQLHLLGDRSSPVCQSSRLLVTNYSDFR